MNFIKSIFSGNEPAKEQHTVLEFAPEFFSVCKAFVNSMSEEQLADIRNTYDKDKHTEAWKIMNDNKKVAMQLVDVIDECYFDEKMQFIRPFIHHLIEAMTKLYADDVIKMRENKQ